MNSNDNVLPETHHVVEDDVSPNTENDLIATRVALGVRLRALRQARGMSLRDAAKAAGLSSSFIRLVERGGTEIALSRLIRLVDTYGAVVVELLSDVIERKTELISLADGVSSQVVDDGVVVTYLARRWWSMEPFVMTMQQGSQLKDLCHSTDEFVHCVAGNFLLTIGEVSYRMKEGDTAFIPGFTDHAYYNDGTETVSVIGAERKERTTEDHVD